MAHVFVTGGSRGIGAAVVERFIAAGDDVSFSWLRDGRSAEALSARTGALALQVDNRDEAQIREAVRAAVSVHGEIDVLVNNAGIAAFRLFDTITTEEWRDMFRVHVEGAFHYIQSVLPAMIHRKAGRIVNVSSIWGITGASCEVHYSAAKAALIGMTRALAKELGPSGITVNCVAPGVIDTEMNTALTTETRAELEAETPLGRIGTSSEVAESIYFLASPASGFITGQVLSPNGGICI